MFWHFWRIQAHHSTVRKIIHKLKTFKTFANLPRSRFSSEFTPLLELHPVTTIISQWTILCAMLNMKGWYYIVLCIVKMKMNWLIIFDCVTIVSPRKSCQQFCRQVKTDQLHLYKSTSCCCQLAVF